MFDKLEKHNNKKISFVINRRINVIKETVLSFFGYKKGNKTAVFNNNYLLSTKK